MILSDPPSERAILAGICRYGSDAYYDVHDIIDEKSFTINSNSIIYSCLKKIMTDNDQSSIDVALILSAAQSIGLSSFFSSSQEINHLGQITKFPVLLENIRRFAVKVKKLQIARLMYDNLGETRDKYLTLNGEESIASILGIAEDSIFSFSSLLSDMADGPKKVFSDINEYIDEKTTNKVDQIGIPTGFSRYDFAIGGGLRRGTVNVLGARPKCGKTTAAINIATNIARQKIPVLFLDTEMKGEDHKNKGLSIFSFDSKYQIPINKIETGHFDPKKAKDIIKEYSELPYYFNSIGGMPFEEQLSVMRRWIAKEVGINDNGKAKDCVIIYDYLKLMDDADIKGDMKEFQVLGFRMTALHNFSLKYDIPILCFIQLNRDGITKESTDTASGSDRIIWLCSNFSILKVKSDEEVAKDGSEYGNRKLVPVIARHGEGLELGDYINVDLQGRFAKMIEKETSHEIENGISYVNTPKQKQPSGFSSEEEEIAF